MIQPYYVGYYWFLSSIFVWLLLVHYISKIRSAIDNSRPKIGFGISKQPNKVLSVNLELYFLFKLSQT
jgi:hypothetical protein